MALQDMTDLIYARDAYREMSKSLHGEEMALGFHEGYLGALGRIFRVIERNMSEKWRQDDNSAIRILDAISLTPKERARILLDDSKYRFNGEEVIMGKYKFPKELKEAVLIGGINGKASVIIDGVTKKAKCHAMGKIKANGIPCLVSENNNGEVLRYTVEAISFENKGKERNWICVRPALFEQAIEHFLENHQMESMLGDNNHVTKMTTATVERCRPDFQAGNTLIEVRILGRNARNPDGFNQGFLASSISQIGKYCQKLSSMKETTEKMILLLVCHAGTEEKQVSFKGKANNEIKKAVENGVEIWTADLQFDIDGISLLIYQNITDRILGN